MASGELVCAWLGAFVAVVHGDVSLKFLNKRHSYVRGERVKLRATVAWPADLVIVDLSGWLKQEVVVKDRSAEYEFDTSLLHSGEYEVRAQAFREREPLGRIVIFPISIAREVNPQRFPVWNWHGVTSLELSWWIERGFNGFRLWSNRAPINPDSRTAHEFSRLFDKATRLGVDIGAYFYPLLSSRWRQKRESLCILPNRKVSEVPYPREPRVMAHARKTVEAWMRAFSDYPSFRHALLSSEYRTPYCINKTVKELAKREASIELEEVLKPEWFGGRLDLNELPPGWRPKDGVISDDNPIYRFLKWWWEWGHGTKVHNALMARIIKAKRPDIITWHDPYRLAPVYNSHKGLDCISTWTYGHPISSVSATRVFSIVQRSERSKRLCKPLHCSYTDDSSSR